MKVFAIFFGIFGPALSLIVLVVVSTALMLWAMVSVAEGNWWPPFLVSPFIVGLFYAQMAIDKKANAWVNNIITNSKGNTNEKAA